MLQKFISIKNVGKFESYNASGDVAFSKLSLIYADNGQGKTTISALLRSLADKNPALVLGRKTLGRDGEPHINMRFEHGNVSFSEGKWSDLDLKLEMFDAKFIQENVYVGNVVEVNQRRALYKFVIGSKGVSLANEVDATDTAIRKLISENSALEKDIKRILKSDMSIKDFLIMPVISTEDIKTELKKTEGEIAAARKVEDVLKRSPLSPLQIGLPSVERCKRSLSKELSDLTSDVMNALKMKIAKLGGSAEHWLEKGMEFRERNDKNVCPFCEGDIEKNLWVKQYEVFFSTAYSELQQELSRLVFDAEMLVNQMQKMEQIVLQNHSLTIYWREHFDSTDPAINLQELVGKSTGAVEVIKQLVEDRRRNLTASLDLSKLNVVEVSFDSIRKTLDEYNSSIRAFNEQVETRKRHLQVTEIAKLQKRILQLVDQAFRVSEEGEEICVKKRRLESEKLSLETKKADLRKQLDQYSGEVFPKYEKLINEYLKTFGSTFSITAKGSNHIGGKPSTSYKLVINEVPFDLGDNDTPEYVPSFKNTLSEGEKSTLAFCYFLAKLAQTEDLAETLVVLDDPLSSFDSYRRDLTKQEIKRFLDRAKQIIVLSHDQYFLKIIWDELKQVAKPLCIRRHTSGSTIQEWSIAAETQSAYFKDCSLLHRFLREGATSDDEMRAIARAIRPVLEYNLQIRSPEAFAVEGKWLGDHLERIRSAGEDDPAFPFKVQYNQLDDINSFSKKYHHTEAHKEPILDSQLQMYVKKTLSAAAGMMTY